LATVDTSPTGGDVRLGSITGAGGGGPSLTVTAGNGDVVLGGTSDLGTLDVRAGSFTSSGASVTVAGATAINTSVADGAVALGATRSGGPLTVAAGTGVVTLSGASELGVATVAAGTFDSRAASMSLSGSLDIDTSAADGDVTLGATTGGGAVRVAAGTGEVTHAGDAAIGALDVTARRFDSAAATLTLGGDSTITVTSAAADAVALGGVDGGRDLTIDAAAGVVTLERPVQVGALTVTARRFVTMTGATLGLGGRSLVETSALNGIELNAQVRGAGSLALDAGPLGRVTLRLGPGDRSAPLGSFAVLRAGGGIQLGSDLFTAGSQTWTGPLTILDDSTIGALGGNLTFTGPVVPATNGMIDLGLIAGGEASFGGTVGTPFREFASLSLATPRVSVRGLYTGALTLIGLREGEIRDARVGGFTRTIHLLDPPALTLIGVDAGGVSINGCAIGNLFCTGTPPPPPSFLAYTPTVAVEIPVILQLGGALFAESPLAIDPDALRFLDAGNEELWAFPDIAP
jgi:hypothetical protein